jgi:osmotically-inducible protein OsmY
MNARFFRFAASIAFLSGVLVVDARAQEQQATPDNSKVNKRDRSKQEPTADQQKENPSDREISRKIRSVIAHDKSLSIYAHNVKIITQNGDVTLKGPVHSDDEKAAIEEKAASVVGKDHVNNQLEVTPEKQ